MGSLIMFWGSLPDMQGFIHGVELRWKWETRPTRQPRQRTPRRNRTRAASPQSCRPVAARGSGGSAVPEGLAGSAGCRSSALSQHRRRLSGVDFDPSVTNATQKVVNTVQHQRKGIAKITAHSPNDFASTASNLRCDANAERVRCRWQRAGDNIHVRRLRETTPEGSPRGSLRWKRARMVRTDDRILWTD